MSHHAKKAWFVCLIASLFPFYAFLQMDYLDTIGVYLAHVGISSEQLSWLSAVYLYADALMLLPAGLLLDRFSARKLLFIGLGLCIAGGILFSTSMSFSWMLAGRLISGIGHAFALLCCFRLVAVWFEAKKQAFVIGLVITIALFGGLVAQTPFTLIAKDISWHVALFLNVGLGLLVLILGYLFVKENNSSSSVSTDGALWKTLKSAIARQQNWWAGLYICLLGLPLMLLGALWNSTYLIKTKHLSMMAASWVATSIFLGTIIGMPLVGWLSDKYQTRKIPMVVGAVGALLLLMVFLNLPVNTSGYVYDGLFFILSLFASTQVLGYPAVVESNPIEGGSTAMGFVNVIIMVGIASFQVGFGALWESDFTRPFAMRLLELALVGSVIMAAWMRETLKRT